MGTATAWLLGRSRAPWPPRLNMPTLYPVSPRLRVGRAGVDGEFCACAGTALVCWALAACPNSPTAAALPTFRKARRPAFLFWTGFSILIFLCTLIVFHCLRPACYAFCSTLENHSLTVVALIRAPRGCPLGRERVSSHWKEVKDDVLTPGPGYHPARAGGHQRRGAITASRCAARE